MTQYYKKEGKYRVDASGRLRKCPTCPCDEGGGTMNCTFTYSGGSSSQDFPAALSPTVSGLIDNSSGFASCPAVNSAVEAHVNAMGCLDTYTYTQMIANGSEPAGTAQQNSNNCFFDELWGFTRAELGSRFLSYCAGDQTSYWWARWFAQPHATTPTTHFQVIAHIVREVVGPPVGATSVVVLFSDSFTYGTDPWAGGPLVLPWVSNPSGPGVLIGNGSSTFTLTAC